MITLSKLPFLLNEASYRKWDSEYCLDWLHYLIDNIICERPSLYLKMFLIYIPRWRRWRWIRINIRQRFERVRRRRRWRQSCCCWCCCWRWRYWWWQHEKGFIPFAFDTLRPWGRFRHRGRFPYRGWFPCRGRFPHLQKVEGTRRQRIPGQFILQNQVPKFFVF